MSLTDNCHLSLVFVSTFLVSYVIYRALRGNGRNKAQLPPTLPSLPVIGSLPFLPGLPEWRTYFMKKSEEIGKIFALYIGNDYTVVLNGRKAIYEAYVKQGVHFADRRELFLWNIGCNRNANGIISHHYDKEFRRQHQLVLSILKDFGFGKDVMETRILAEVSVLIHHFRDHQGRPFWPEDAITPGVVNVIVSIVLGHRLDDSEVRELVSAVHSFVGSLNDNAALEFFPLLRFFPLFRSKFTAWLSHRHNLDRIVSKCIASATLNSFVECYKKREGSQLDLEQLHYTVRDLIAAGSETTASALHWALVLLACPNGKRIQAKMRAEIDAQVPRDQLPSLTDRCRLPYVEATILELMRVKTIAPLAAFRLTTRDTKVGGYLIPAQSVVIPNLYSVHMDPEVWQEPTEFRPERFLDESGRVVGKERVIPFSLGHRSCLGELLAQQKIYLFLTGLIQNFIIKPPEGCEAVETREKVGFTVAAPEPYEVRLIYRA